MPRSPEADLAAMARIRETAAKLDCIVEDDFELLAGIKPSTAEAWRKRGTGPAYVLLGNTYLYPVASLREFIAEKAKEPRWRGQGDAL